MKISTDDHSFKQFLNTLCHNCLTEHVAVNFLPETIAEIIVDTPHLHQECIDYLIENKTREGVKLSSLLEEKYDEEIIELMKFLFSKKLLIEILIQYTDEYAREDIIENQLNWNSFTGENNFYN